jgi:hypothetical protein
MGVTSGAGTAYPSGKHEFNPCFWWGSCYSIFSFVDRCLSFCTFSFGRCVLSPITISYTVQRISKMHRFQ